MRLFRLLPLVLFSALSVLHAAPQTPAPESIKDPKALFAAAAPLYDFANPSLKPWRLKATYQLYDPNGNPADQGTWEYWWASPTVYRSTWTRGADAESEWHLADGSHANTNSGDVLHLFDTEFPKQLFAPFPTPIETHPPERLEREMIPLGKVKYPCVRILGTTKPLVPGQPPRDQIVSTYCFDPKLPILVLKSEAGGVSDTYGSFVSRDGRILPRSFLESVDNRKLLAVTIDAIDGLDPIDPALKPSADAKTTSALPTNIPSAIMQGQRIKDPNPEYPERAKQQHLTGSVMLEAVIGTDGRIHNLQVISAPGQLLTDSSVKAVSKWEYKPYLLNGQPVEVRTTIFVTYAMER
jgi:TonB family protein